MILIVAYLVLPTVSTMIIGLFPCDDLLNGEVFLRADYSISCLAADREGMEVFAIVAVAVYPVGIPMTFASLLVWFKKSIMAEGAEEEEGKVKTGDEEEEQEREGEEVTAKVRRPHTYS